MKLWIGLGLFVIGGISCLLGFGMNSTPMPVGPIPTIGGGILALIGAILFLSAL